MANVAIKSNTNTQRISKFAVTSQEVPLSNGLVELGEQRSWKFFIQICLALDVIHAQGIVHADLKPSNLLMTGRDYDLKLTDFGVSFNYISSIRYANCRVFDLP